MKHSKDWERATREGARAELAQIERKLESVKPLLARRAVVMRILTVLGELDAIDDDASVADGTTTVVVSNTPRTKPVVSESAELVWQRAERLLEVVGHPMRVPDIAQALKDAGWKGGKNVRESVRSSMERRGDVFVKVAPGVMALKAWPAEKRTMTALVNGTKQTQMSLN